MLDRSPAQPATTLKIAPPATRFIMRGADVVAPASEAFGVATGAGEPTIGTGLE